VANAHQYKYGKVTFHEQREFPEDSLTSRSSIASGFLKKLFSRSSEPAALPYTVTLRMRIAELDGKIMALPANAYGNSRIDIPVVRTKI
jgi:autotransporter translocation and assembly factor TamB